MSGFIRLFLALTCVVALAFGVAACGSSGSATTTVTSTVEQQNDNENDDNEKDDNENDDNENDNESVSKQKKECLKHNKGYPEDCADIP